MNLNKIYENLKISAQKNGYEIDENKLRQKAWMLRDRMMFEQFYSFNGSDDEGSGGGIKREVLLNSVLNTRTSVRYESIQSAIDSAEANDILIVSPGVYSEGISIDKSVEILGPNSDISGNSENRNTEAIIKTPLNSGIINYTSSQPTTYRKYSLFINTGVNNVKISGFKFEGDMLFDSDDNNHVGSAAIGTGRNSLNNNIQILNNIILNYQQKNINFNSIANNSAAIWLAGTKSFNIQGNYINSNSIGINILGPTFTNYVGSVPEDHVININNNIIKSLNSALYLRALFGDITIDENDIEIIDRVQTNYGIYLRAFHSHNVVGQFRGKTLIYKNIIDSSNGIYSELGNSANLEIIENTIKTGSSGIEVVKTYNQNQYLKVNSNHVLYIGHPWWVGWTGIYLSNNTATPSFYVNLVEIKDNIINGLHDSAEWYRYESANTIAIRIDGTSNPSNTTITGNETTGYTTENQMIYLRQSSGIAFNLQDIIDNNNMLNASIDNNDIIGG